MVGNLGSGILLLAFIVISPCLFISLLRTVFPALSLTNPLVLLVAFIAVMSLAWAVRSYLRKTQLGQAQFRWRRARYCSRCDAVFVAGEKIYTSPRQLEDILWHNPAQFASM